MDEPQRGENTSPPRKRIDSEEQMDVDSENNKRKAEIEKEIAELKHYIVVLQSKENVNSESAVENTDSLDGFTCKDSLNKVHERHVKYLKGFKYVMKAKADGACLNNSAAMYIFEDENKGCEVKKMVNEHIVNNWNCFYKNIIPIPNRQTVGVGANSREVSFKTEEEFLSFLSGPDSLHMFSDAQEIVALA